MSINIFCLESCQVLVWVALSVVALLGILQFLYGESMFDILLTRCLPYTSKWVTISCKILFGIVMLLWVIVVFANHQTVWNDLVNFAFLVGFTVVGVILVYFVSSVIFILECIVVLICCKKAVKEMFED